MGFVAKTEDDLIRAVGRYSAEFPQDLANHLPMVLHAMAELGASQERLNAYADLYMRRNAVPLPPRAVEPLRDDTWQAALGDRAREADLRSYFVDRIARDGREAVLADVMDVLSDGVAASATHGLMRLAYAILRDDSAEVAAALGYWAATYLPSPERPLAMAPQTVPELLAAMRADPAFEALNVENCLLWHWISKVNEMPAYSRLIGGVDPVTVTLADLREAGVLLYARTRSFEALHVVTGAHWIRVVQPYLPQPGLLIARFLDVTLALYPKMGMPGLPSPDAIESLRRAAAPSWDVLAEAAVASDDEHDHSLLFSCREEERATDDPVYRRLAAMRLGMLDQSV